MENNKLYGDENRTKTSQYKWFYEYSKDDNISEAGSIPKNLNINVNDDDEILNVHVPITSQEISKCVKSLKIDKTFDYIWNEYIKTSIDLMMPIYINLFNLIFYTGIFPSVWLERIIRPIYKRKGILVTQKITVRLQYLVVLGSFSPLF